MGRGDQLAREHELEDLVRRGELDQAALVARALGQLRYAAKLFEDAKLPYQAAVCAYEAGDSTRALAGFLSVPKGDGRYRAACVHVLRIAAELSSFTAAIDAYVAEFRASEPNDPHELRALFRLGVLYQTHEVFDQARDVLKRVSRMDPTNADARQRVMVLEGLVQRAPAVYDAIARRDNSAWRPPTPSTPPSAAPVTPEPRAVRASTAPIPPPAAAARPPPLPRPPPPRPASPPPVPPPAPPAPEPPSIAEVASEDVVVDTSDISVSWSIATSAEPSHPSVAPVERTMQSRKDTVPPPTAELTPGTLVANRYRVEREVGRGGMGVVYHATDLELDVAVAIKVFSQRLDQDGLLHRFKQELALNRQLAHPNIVRLYDIGAHAGRKFISMELLSGESLRQVLESRRLPIDEAIDVLRQVCQGLASAHALGIVHRDVKPDNLFVTTPGLVKLTDFGLAKKQGDTGGGTVVGFMGGSPNYMAPEQITDFGSVGPSADLYSVGVVAYELFTGKKPFFHKERQKVLEMHLTMQPAPPSTIEPRLLPSIDRLVLDLLKKDRAERIASCEEVLARLERFDVGAHR